MNIKPQIAKTVYVDALVTGINFTTTQVIIVIVVTFVMSLYMKGSMDYIISLIRFLQMVVLLPMFSFVAPANLMMLLSSLVNIVMYDLMETDTFSITNVFNFEENTNIRI
jgi:hypothetical protein